MTSDPRRVRELFDAVIDLAPAERAAALDALIPDDAALRRDVDAVIARAEAPESVLDLPIMPTPPGADHQAMIGMQIGPYQIERLIGAGGMGTVFQAARTDDTYRKRVAIKVVQRDVASAVTLARFRRERQILASLAHANIAALFDGGVLPDGRPYLVMEQVDGAPITTWCSERRLGIRERMRLFEQVCAAVDHAHRNLVVHRDLKPANILVTDDGTVKLLDFGVAQLLQAEETHDPNAMPLTHQGMRAYTPEYASPEQIRGDALSTASDVYSLGVILFELLTGNRPHRADRRAAADVERAVLSDAVPRPGAVLTAASSGNLAGMTLAQARKALRGDIDSIVLLALRPAAARRYSSVEAFSHDVRRYLDGRTVRAQGERWSYRARTFVRRNRVATLASSVAATALLVGAGVAAVAAHRARIAQVKAVQANLFLTELLASVQPETGSRDAKVSDVLDVAAARVAHDFPNAPDVRAGLETVIGESYDGLGRYDAAESHLKMALRLRAQVDGAKSPSAAIGLAHLGRLYMDMGVLDSSAAMFRQAMAIRQPSGRAADSLHASLLDDLGSVAHMNGHAAESERLHRQALAIWQRLDGPASDAAGVALADIGVAVGEQGRLADAEELHREALAIIRRNHPRDDERVAGMVAALAGVLDMEGKNTAADSAYRQALAIRKAALGPTHPDYALTLFNYSGFVFDQKRYGEAAEYAREILALRGTTLPESHPAVAAALQTLGMSLDQLGDRRGGESALLESLALRRKYNQPDNWVIASSEGALGEHYTLTGDYPRAERLLVQAAGELESALGRTDVRTQRNTRRLVALYRAWGKPDQAKEYAARLEQR